MLLSKAIAKRLLHAKNSFLCMYIYTPGPKDCFDGHNVSASHEPQATEVRLFIHINICTLFKF